MKSYIPHRLSVINQQDIMSLEDPVFMECMRLAFQWANDMGFQGKRVYSLFFQKPNPVNIDPLNQHIFLWCKIECTEEERKQWEERQKNLIENGVNNLFPDDSSK